MIAFTYFSRLTTVHGARYRTTWEKLVDRLAVPRIVADKEKAPGISFATFRGDKRALDNVERVFVMGLDLDKNVDWDLLLVRFGKLDAFLHTTWSSTDEAPRARVFLRLARPVTSEEYRRVYAAVVDRVEASGLVVDRKASDPSRFWFLPSTPPGGRYRYNDARGNPVDVEGALRLVPPEPPPSPSRPLSNAPRTVGDVERRARAYLAKCPPAISGQGGHTHTFVVAQRLVRSFGLDEDTAYALMCDWNANCQPPWRERDLRRKIRQAIDRGAMQIGDLRDAERRAS